MSDFALLDTLRLESGERWGDVAADVQRADAAAILDASFSRGRVRRARRRAQDLEQTQAVFHWLGRARGWSKTSDLAAILLEVLVTQAPPGSRSYAFAADRDQAGLLVDALAGFIRRGGPKLAEMFEVQAWKIIVRQTGASLEAMAADEASAWGLRPFFVVCDELPMWPTTRGARRLWEAISSAVPKTGGRLVVAGTAGDPAHWAARVREHALADPLWRVAETHGPPPWMPEELVDEQRRRLPESSFQRLFENVWTSGEDRLVAEEDLAACVVLDGPQKPVSGMRHVIGLDIGLRRDRTVAAVCHLEGGIVTLDRLGVWEGTRLRPVSLGEVEEWLYRASSEYGAAEIVFDFWQAAQLTERLRKRGVRMREYTFSAASVGKLASTLFQVLHEHALRLPHDEALLDELRNVRLRETSPGVLRLDHDSGRHDDRAVALALAVHRLVEKGEPQPTTISVARANFRDRRTRRTLRVAGQQASRWDPTAGMRRQPDPVEAALTEHGVVAHDVPPDAHLYDLRGLQ
jgi:phage terminase large subunit-like protein